jgi:hypothetical protein
MRLEALPQLVSLRMADVLELRPQLLRDLGGLRNLQACIVVSREEALPCPGGSSVASRCG